MKKIYLYFCFYILPLTIAYCQVDLTKGLVACYQFSGNPNDGTGNYNGTLNRGTILTTDRKGNSNQAYLFNGNGSNVNIGKGPALHNTDFSISLWFQQSDNINQSNVIFSNRTANSEGIVFTIPGRNYPYNTSRHLAVTVRGQSFWTQALIDTQKWYHGVFTFKYQGNNNNQAKFYINCKLDSSTTMRDIPPPTLTQDMFIGAEFIVGLPYSFQGTIDDLRIYNKVLTQDEVSALAGEKCLNTNIVIPNSVCMNEVTNFTANGVSTVLTPSYQWLVDGAETNKNASFSYTFPKKAADYTAKINLNVAYNIGCNATNTTNTEKIITIKNCTIPPVIVLPTTSDKILIPNIFTPNADNINDTWKILGLENYTDVEVLIYNRWGNLILSSKDYKTAWDGTINNSPAPIGMYAYKIRFAGKDQLKGFVIIER